MQKLYFDHVYNAVLVGGTILLGRVAGLFDAIIIDGAVNLSAYITKSLGVFTGRQLDMPVERQDLGLVDAVAIPTAMILDPNAHAGRGPESDTRSLEPEADEPRNPRQPRAATGRQLAESQGPPSGRPQQALLAAQQPATRTPMSPVEHEWRLWFGGGPGTWATWHLESGVGYRANRAALELGLFYQPRSDHAFGNGSVRIETFGGFAAGCVRSGTRWRALVCLRAQGGAERVQGVGFQTGRASTLPGFGVGPSGGFEAGSRWVVGLSLYLQMAVLRDEFKVDNMPDTLQAPPISAWLVARIALTSRSDSH